MKHWYALYTKPRKERYVSSVLESEGLETYLPTIQVRKNGRRKTEPLFSCYLFVRMDPSVGLSTVRWTPGLRRVVSFGGQPAAVPEETISMIRQRLAEMRESGYGGCGFKPGDQVMIKAGPFRDLEAIFEEVLSSRDRVRILVGFLGRWTPCQVSLNGLEKAY